MGGCKVFYLFMWFVGIENLFDDRYELFCCVFVKDFICSFFYYFFFLFFLGNECCRIYIS